MDTIIKSLIGCSVGLLISLTVAQYKTITYLQEDYDNTHYKLSKTLVEYYQLKDQYNKLNAEYEQLKNVTVEQEEPCDAVPQYDVPISKELQEYTYDLCRSYNVEYELVLAVMWHESNFDTDAISPTDDYGIMQINKVNHESLKSELGFVDIMDPKNNIHSGVYLLSELYKKYDDTAEVLVAYNQGPTGAERLWRSGIYTTDYSTSVQDKYLQIKENQYSVSN